MISSTGSPVTSASSPIRRPGRIASASFAWLGLRRSSSSGKDGRGLSTRRVPTIGPTAMSTCSCGAKRVTPVRMSCGTLTLSDEAPCADSSKRRSSPSFQAKRSSSFLARFCCRMRNSSTGVTSSLSSSTSPIGTPRAADFERRGGGELLLAELALQHHVAAEGLVRQVGAAVDRHAVLQPDAFPYLSAAQLQHQRVALLGMGQQQRREGHVDQTAFAKLCDFQQLPRRRNQGLEANPPLHDLSTVKVCRRAFWH